MTVVPPGQPIPGAPPPVSDLQQIFFGRVSPQQYGFMNTYTGTVQSANGVDCFVTLDGFENFGGVNGPPQWSARYERRCTPSGWASPPPQGTRCVVCFPQNEVDHSPWVLTFVGWP